MARLIDADALIKTLNEEKIKFNADVNYFILNAPTIDAKPVRHGMWIGKPMMCGYSRMRCSVCDNVFLENKEKWNYCPCCGARMDEE